MSAFLFRHLKTLHTRFLLALVIVGIVPSGLVGLILVNLESQALSEQSTRELTGLAQSFARDLDTFLEDALKDAEAIAGLPDIVSMDPARQESLLLNLHAHYDRHAQLAAADLSGQLLAAAVAPPVPVEQVSIAHIKSFQTAANEGRQDWWIGPALSDDSLILHMHTPIRDKDQQVIGVLGSPVSLPSLSGVLKQLSIGGNGQAFVLDDTGRVLLHPNPAEIEKRKNYSEYIGSPDGGLPERLGTATYTIGGETRIAGFVPIPNLGWTIVVDRPKTDVLAPAIAARNLATAGLIVSIFLSLLAAIVLARGLTRPVRELAVAAQALGAGNSKTPLPEHIAYDNELGTLVATFAAMREAIIEREAALRKAHDELEKRVEQRTAELAKVNSTLIQEEEQFRLIFELAPIGISTHRLDGRFLRVNQAYCDMVEYSKAELMSKSFKDVTHPDDLDENLAWHHRIFTEEISHFRMEKRYITKHGKIIFIILQVALVRDAGGQPLHFIAQVVDITERKHAEQALATARDQALEANRFKDQLLAKVSHELRTPLNGILGYASMLRENFCGLLSGEQHEVVGRIIINVDKLMDHINNLLDQAQIKANKQRDLQIVPFEPAGLIDQIRTVLAPQAQAKGLELTDQIAADVPATLFGDVQHLQDILINLVSNAIKFTARGRVHIYIYRPDETRWALEVSDTGSGVPLKAQAYIFEPFEQVDGSITREYGGIGLGLAIVKQLTTLMGGQITLNSSTVGQGSTFTVQLPLQSVQEESA